MRQKKSLFKKIALTLLILSFIGYTLYQARFLVFGHTLRMYTPKKSTMQTTEKSILFSGNASRAGEVKLNGTSIPINSKGYFEKKVFLLPGENRYTVRIINVFKKEELRTFTIIRI